MATKTNHPLLGCLLLGVLLLSPVDAAGLPPADMKGWRQPAVDRQRRIIFNNDGCEIFLLPQATKEAFLAARTTPLLGTQVDSIFYCTTQGFGLFTHFTKVGQMFMTREGRYGSGQKNDNRMPAFVEAGIDPLQVMVDFSRQHGLEVFCSFRMNDNHDGSSADYGPIRFKYNAVKSAHPDYLLGRQGEPLKYGGWSALDYGRPEVRELMFRYVEEVCHNYDLDGIELDFFRHPVFFKPTTRGQPVTTEERAGMTDLVRRIRKVADEAGVARGRPFLVAMRVPDSLEYDQAIGLDVERWLADDQLDILVVGGYFKLNDWDYSVALARKHGVKIYPSLDDSRVRDDAARNARQSDLAYRGRAAAAWGAGVDGIYFFNYFSDSNLKFDQGGTVFRTVGDSRQLASLDKDYFGSIRGVGVASFGNYPLAPFQRVETLNPAVPRRIGPGESAMARIQIAESSSGKGAGGTQTLRLRFDRGAPGNAAIVSLNGRTLPGGRLEDKWLVFPLESSWVKAGANEVAVKLQADASAPLTWSDLMLSVRHGR